MFAGDLLLLLVSVSVCVSLCVLYLLHWLCSNLSGGFPSPVLLDPWSDRCMETKGRDQCGYDYETLKLIVRINTSKVLTTGGFTVRRPDGTDRGSGLWNMRRTNESPTALYHFMWNLTSVKPPIMLAPHTSHTSIPTSKALSSHLTPQTQTENSMWASTLGGITGKRKWSLFKVVAC